MAELEIKPNAAARLRVIAVILSAAAITLTLIFLITGGGGEFFSPKTTLSTLMPDATGLVTGSDVRLSGIKIGEVANVDVSPSLDPQRAVRVDMRVYQRFLKNIPRDSETSIKEDTLVGYQFVSIDEGKSPIPVAEDGALRSQPLKQAALQADLILALRSELSQVDSLLVQISSGETTIGHFVVGDQEYTQLLRQVSAFDNAVHSFVGPASIVGQSLFSDKLYNRIRAPVLRVDNALAGIQRGEGAGGRLFANDQQYNDVLRQLKDLRTTLASTGKALEGDSGYVKIRELLAATDNTISALNAGGSGAGQLLKNPQLYDSLNGSLRNLEAFLKDLRENPRKYLRYKVF